MRLSGEADLQRLQMLHVDEPASDGAAGRRRCQSPTSGTIRSQRQRGWSQTSASQRPHGYAPRLGHPWRMPAGTTERGRMAGAGRGGLHAGPRRRGGPTSHLAGAGAWASATADASVSVYGSDPPPPPPYHLNGGGVGVCKCHPAKIPYGRLSDPMPASGGAANFGEWVREPDFQRLLARGSLGQEPRGSTWRTGLAAC